MVNDLEKLIDHTCQGCGNQHEAKFFSLFLGHNHYIIGDCNHCNYRIEIRADELGGGIFMPNGEPVNDTLPKEHTSHMRTHLAESGTSRSVTDTFAKHRLRIVPEDELRKR